MHIRMMVVSDYSVTIRGLLGLLFFLHGQYGACMCLDLIIGPDRES
jgi:hypothetical protein